MRRLCADLLCGGCDLVVRNLPLVSQCFLGRVLILNFAICIIAPRTPPVLNSTSLRPRNVCFRGRVQSATIPTVVSYRSLTQLRMGLILIDCCTQPPTRASLVVTASRAAWDRDHQMRLAAENARTMFRFSSSRATRVRKVLSGSTPKMPSPVIVS